jgi:LDH2 family malate/lactate/ureidoglycolate dehydrogenase
MLIEPDRLRTQIQHILAAWAMPPGRAAITADVLLYADLHGIDSHGVSMIPVYDA